MNIRNLYHANDNQEPTQANFTASHSHNITVREEKKPVDANNNNTNLTAASGKKRKYTKRTFTNDNEVLYLNEKGRIITEEKFKALQAAYALRNIENPPIVQTTRGEYRQKKESRAGNQRKAKQVWVIHVNGNLEKLADEIGDICFEMQNKGKNMEALIPGFQKLEKMSYSKAYKAKQKNPGNNQKSTEQELVVVNENLIIIPSNILTLYRDYYCEKHREEPNLKQMTRSERKLKIIKRSNANSNSRKVWTATINGKFYHIPDAEGEKYNKMILEGKNVQDEIPGFQRLKKLSYSTVRTRIRYQREEEDKNNNNNNNNNRVQSSANIEQYPMTPARSANLGVFVSKQTLTANTTVGEQQEITKENSGSRLTEP